MIEFLMVLMIFLVVLEIIMMKALIYNSYCLYGIVGLCDFTIIWNFVYILIHPAPPRVRNINEALEVVRGDKK